MNNEERFWKAIKVLKEAKIDFSKKGDEERERRKDFIAAKIKAYRFEHKLTQEDLAKQLGIQKLQIIRWEGADNMPNKLALDKLRTEGII